MVTLNRFLQCVQENAERITHYENAGDGSGGGCDCIGLIIGALRLAGFRWPGVHGSNWAARNAMATLEYIDTERHVFIGEIVYKAHTPGDAGYNLPVAYDASPDQKDYYHVGVITSVQPLIITHCTGVAGGIKRDTALGAWRWGGKLKYVNYEEGENVTEPIYQAVVHADGNPYPVKMREQASQKSDVLTKVPQGETVDVLGVVGGDEGEWAFILYGGVAGYMMKKFLYPVNGENNDSDGVSTDTVEIPLHELETALNAAKTAYEALNRMLKG